MYIYMSVTYTALLFIIVQKFIQKSEVIVIFLLTISNSHLRERARDLIAYRLFICCYGTKQLADWSKAARGVGDGRSQQLGSYSFTLTGSGYKEPFSAALFQFDHGVGREIHGKMQIASSKYNTLCRRGFWVNFPSLTTLYSGFYFWR